MLKYFILVQLIIICIFNGCNSNKIIKLNNKNAEQESIIEKLNNEITEQKELITELNNNIITIPSTYEEAIEIMKKLNIQNIVLEYLVINGVTYTVIEVVERALEIGTDVETIIYDKPDISGNIILTLPFKNQINATMIAIVEEPRPRDWGSGYEHWVKIRMDNDIVGWVKGEYTNINKSGQKYLTNKNIWLDENYARYLR